MSRKAPDFEKKANCQKCNTSFGMFTRQHHCRNCGKSYCEKCSAKQIALPHYGFNDAVRVCEPCYDSVRSAAAAAAARPAPGRSPPPANIPSEPVTTTSSTSPTSSSSSSTDASSPKVRARSDSSDDVTNNQSSNTSAAAAAVAVAPPKKVSKCVCGMPLCICPPDKEEKKAEEKKVEAPKAKAVTAPSKTSSAPSSTAPSTSSSTFGTFGFGQSRSAPSYDLKGDLNEQCRDAIKARDHQGVVTLLGARADARFIDRTGNSLVHLAAMFDQIQTVTLLIKNGANIWDKNPSGETAVDLAPPSLAHKMKELSPPPQ